MVERGESGTPPETRLGGASGVEESGDQGFVDSPFKQKQPEFPSLGA